uniref:Calcium channel, voltage-dependent, alpha 2/delta subunit 1a n=1 Tax=Oryzias latipes TaxID=8090 RepID=A0A3P9HV88_ORYLA
MICFFLCLFRVKEWVDQMQKDLIALTDTASGLENLIKVNNYCRVTTNVESNNARQLVATASGNIEKLLDNRSQALKRLATEAEKFQKEHQWTEKSETEFEEKQKGEDGDELKNRFIPDDFTNETDENFKRRVSFNTTAVHIPTDIYEGSTIILNELNWTDALEDVFRKNREEDPSLLWQVFGSATGLARYYPASPWTDSSSSPDKIDLYDVRRRPWYIQGAASPKDMLILVDASGSVSGLTLKLIKTSVHKMLETLSDDDFVNVVSFNKSARPVACFEHLVQANVRNKRVLKDAVQRIKAEGITNYTSGFELAFAQLAQTNVSRADCNRIIMLFTDGGEEKAEEILKNLNEKKEVRIFTFSVGQHSYDKGPVQWMACTNKGYYYEIPSIGAIRLNTQEYLDVLGRPMVKADRKAKQVQWTNVYLDALDLGLVITGTLPVFNKTDSKKSQNQLILGVMAIDVSLEDIKRLTPRFTFGPNGYYFAIDPNGYVLLHPNLQPMPVTLDFLDAELENDIKVVLLCSIKMCSAGLKCHNARLMCPPVPKGKSISFFCFSSRSLALVLPDYNKYYIRATIGDTITQAKCKCHPSEKVTFLMVSLLPFTQTVNKCVEKDITYDLGVYTNTEFLVMFNDYIDRRTPNDPECNVELMNRLLLDAGITADLIKIWKKSELPNGVKAVFVATDGGITRVYPESAGMEWTEEVETYESSFYKRSLESDLYIFTPKPYNKNLNIQSVKLTEGSDVMDDVWLLCCVPVVGVKLDIKAWMNSLMNTTTTINCKDEICGCRINNAYIDCIVLDDGGFLVMSNQEEYIKEIGNFFGVIDPTIMRALVNDSLFTSKSTYDYQSLCDPKRTSKTAAGPRSVYVPTIADILNLGWWATAADKMPDSMTKEVCITEQTQYYFENKRSTFSGSVDCGNCSRLFLAEKLPKTNLVFIIADAKGTCSSCVSSKLIQEEQQCILFTPLTWQELRGSDSPGRCFDNCGGVSGLSPSLWLTVALQVLLLWIGTDCRLHTVPS